MTRLDGIRVRELPIPTSVSLSSVISGFNDPWLSNHFLMGVGESATITAWVLDQNGAIMTDLVPMISTTAAESGWNNGIYTPETAGKAIFTASYGEFTSTLQVTTIDYDNYIPSDKFKEFISSATGSPNYSNIIVGPEISTKAGEIVIAENGGESQNYYHVVPVIVLWQIKGLPETLREK